MGIILGVLKLEVSVYNVTENVTEKQGGKLFKTFVPITLATTERKKF